MSRRSREWRVSVMSGPVVVRVCNEDTSFLSDRLINPTPTNKTRPVLSDGPVAGVLERICALRIIRSSG